MSNRGRCLAMSLLEKRLEHHIAEKDHHRERNQQNDIEVECRQPVFLTTQGKNLLPDHMENHCERDDNHQPKASHSDDKTAECNRVQVGAKLGDITIDRPVNPEP